MYTSMCKKAVFKLHFAVIVSIYAERSVALLGLTPLHTRKICVFFFPLGTLVQSSMELNMSWPMFLDFAALHYGIQAGLRKGQFAFFLLLFCELFLVWSLQAVRKTYRETYTISVANKKKKVM